VGVAPTRASDAHHQHLIAAPTCLENPVMDVRARVVVVDDRDAASDLDPVAQHHHPLIVLGNDDRERTARRCGGCPAIFGGVEFALRNLLAAPIERQQQTRIGRANMIDGATLDHHGCTQLSDAEQSACEADRQVHATMARREAGQAPRVERDAVPCQPLLIAHRCIVIFVGSVVGVLLQNGEDAGRRRIAVASGRDGADRNAGGGR